MGAVDAFQETPHPSLTGKGPSGLRFASSGTGSSSAAAPLGRVAGTAEAESAGKSPAIIAAPAGNPKPGAGELVRAVGGRNFRFGAKAPGETASGERQ